MATRYGEIGDTSRNNPESTNIDNNSQDNIDNDSQDNYQEDFHELDNIDPHHPAGLQHLMHEIEQLRQTIEASNNDPMDAIQNLEQKLNWLAITLCPPTEPIGEVLSKYTHTLCTAPKKTQLENSLLQDIPMLNGNDSSQLEDWLTDIETTSELMGESRTKLAQAKSRGLMRTLISEALALNRNWEDIKDPPSSKNMQFRHLHIHLSLNGHTTKGKRIPSSIHPSF